MPTLPCTSSPRAPLATVAALLTLTASLTAGDRLQRYGAGTAGSGNFVPQIWANTTPRTGDAGFRLQIEKALGGSFGIVFLGTNPGDFTFDGVRLLIDPSNVTLAGSFFIGGNGPGTGSGSFALPIPRSNALVGQHYRAQIFTLDDFAPNPLGFGATEGLTITPTLAAQLIASRSRPGQPDPQTAIELASGQTADFDQGFFEEGTGFAYGNDGALLFAAAPTTGKLHVYDARTFPPRWRQNVAIGSTSATRFVAVTPDGQRLYVVHGDRAGTSPAIEVLDARDGATLGQPDPRGNLRVEGIGDARTLLFTPDGARAFVISERGGDGSGAALVLVDVRLGSTTYHQELGRVTFPGCLGTAGALSPDGATVYVGLQQPGGLGELAIVDTASLVVFDADIPTAGVQNLGGEVSRARTPLPRGMARLAADPRGGVVYFGSIGSIGRVQVDPTVPSFARLVSATGGLAFNAQVTSIAIADAGERIYLATAGEVVEVDPSTLTRARAWPIADTLALILR